MMRYQIIHYLCYTSLLLLCSSAFAGEGDITKLAKKSQNPIENMATLPFDHDFNYGYGTDNNTTQYMLNIKPVIPFSLSENWNVITRTILPVMNQAKLLPQHNYQTGIGDINASFYVSPSHPGAIVWGIGPTGFLPTASQKQLGLGKYSIGPSLVLLVMPRQWVIGFLTYNVWSIGGQSNRPNVNAFEFQYFINYNFADGWFLVASPTLTADWTATSSNRWTVPVGGGIGRVFKISKQAINASIQIYDNVITPKIGPNWQLELNISFLFPH